MSSLLLLLFIIISRYAYVYSDVNININGESWICNNNPSKYKISPLLSNDKSIISKLRQVHIFNRHGARVGATKIAYFLPNKNLSYHCNVTEVTTRQYNNNDQENIYSFRKIYVNNEQLIEGNCKWTQSSYQLIPQFIANGNIIKNAYIGNQIYHLFNQTILNQISSNLYTKSFDNRITITSTDYERTIASVLVMASTIFKSTNNNTNKPIFNVNTHDQHSDPWIGWIQPCLDQSEYKLWNSMISNDPKYKNTAQDDVYSSTFGQNTINSFISEGGIWTKNKTGKDLQYLYCKGTTLPLTNNTFWDVVKYSYLWEAAEVNTTYWLKTDQCIGHFRIIPILYKILTDINSMKNNINVNNDEYPQLIMHSAHDSTLLHILKGLNMWNHELIIFGELVILEIYTSANDDDSEYLFRWTKKGKFLPYPFCDYKNGQTELCDLDIMLNNSFNEAVDMDTYSNNICANVLTDCRCGYCHTNTNTTSEVSDHEPCDSVDKRDLFILWIIISFFKLLSI